MHKSSQAGPSTSKSIAFLTLKPGAGTSLPAIPNHYGGAIVLLHGLNQNDSHLSDIVQKAKEKFKDNLLIIQPTNRFNLHSVFSSITEQVQDAGCYIHNKLHEYGHNPATFPIVIVGYSQGGLVATHLVKNFAQQLNIAGMVTINAPLRGIPVLQDRLTRHWDELKADMQSLQPYLNTYASNLLKKLQQQARLSGLILKGGDYPLVVKAVSKVGISQVKDRLYGLEDMLENSTCVQEASAYIRSNEYNNIVIMGSYHPDFTALLDANNNQYTDFQVAITKHNNSFNQFITRNYEDKHDTLIPLKSQLCRGNSFNDLTDIPGTIGHTSMEELPMPNQPNIKMVLCKDLIHSRALVALDLLNRLKDPLQGEPILSSSNAINYILNFVKECIQANQSEMEAQEAQEAQEG